jgi:hypothetical protein
MDKNKLLERNIEYVLDAVRENPGEFDLFQLTIETRLRYDKENPLGLKDARDAIAAAEKDNKIYSQEKYPFLPGQKTYYPKSAKEEYLGVVKSVDSNYGKAKVILTDLSGKPVPLKFKAEVLAEFGVLYKGAKFKYILEDGKRTIEVLNPGLRPKKRKSKPLDFSKTIEEFFKAVKEKEKKK